MGGIAFVGMDVHKATIAVAVAEGARGGEVRQLGIFPNRAEVIAKLAQRLAGDGRALNFCYEAGPCGYGLQRQLESLGHTCMVVAPSLIPSKPGDRVKTADPFAGDVFIFRPKRADRVKILVYDGTGLCLYAKRLEAGRFSWPSPADGVARLTSAQLATLLEGLPWHRLQPRVIPRPSTAW